MAMPTMNELSQVFGNWNPEAYLQGRQQVDLANQFEQGRIREQGQDIRAKELGNIFAEQNNPLRVQQQGLVNEGLGYTNRKGAVEAGHAEGLAKWKLEADQMEQLKKIKQSDLDMADLEVKRMLRDPDPTMREQGQKLWEFTDAVRAEKLKWDREMEKERYSQQQQTGRAVEQNQTTLEAARIGAQSRESIAATRAQAIPKPPTTPHAAWVQALGQELQAGRITREQYLESVAAAVNADLAARAMGKTDGITSGLTPQGQLELKNKTPAPQVQVPSPASPAPQPAPTGLPKVGEVRKGYVYMGGDPSKQSSWKKQ